MARYPGANSKALRPKLATLTRFSPPTQHRGSSSSTHSSMQPETLQAPASPPLRSSTRERRQPALLGNYEVTDGRRPVNRQQSSATSVPPLPPPPAALPADQAPIMIADGNLLHANVNDTNPGVNDGATNADESAYADESERGAVDAPESSASDDESSDDEDAYEEDSDEEQEAKAEER